MITWSFNEFKMVLAVPVRENRGILRCLISLEQNKISQKEKPPFYSTLKSLLNKRIFKMTYFSGHMHFNTISIVYPAISLLNYRKMFMGDYYPSGYFPWTGTMG